MMLKSKLANGLIWVGLGVYVSRAVSLVKLIILARLLNPSDFGVLGIVLSVIAAFNLFANLGLKPTLVQYKKNIDQALITGFWLNLLISCFISTLCFSLVSPVSKLINAPLSVMPLRVLVWMMVIDGIGIVPAAILERRMAYRLRSNCDILMALTGFAVAVVLARIGFSVWSLVWSQIASSIVLTGSLYIASGWLPSGRPDRAVARDLAAYGRFIVGDSLVSFVNQNIDTLSLSRLRTVVDVGIYSAAYRLSSLSVEVVGILNHVTFPAFSKFHAGDEQLNNLLFRVNRYTAMIASAIAFYSLIFGPSLIPVVLGEGWTDAIVPFQLLALLGFFRSINRNFGSALTATGAARLTMQSTLTSSVFLVVTMPLLVYFFGANGAALALAIYSIFSFIIVLRYLERGLGIAPGKFILGTMTLPLLAALLAGGASALVLTAPLSGLLRLIIGTFSFGVVLVTSWSLLLPEDVRTAWELLYKVYASRTYEKSKAKDMPGSSTRL
jgi:O-antigen/teichoic acid export membrane protein